MNNEYIEKIVSHIKNSSSKETSQVELTDHYIEKQRFYEEIGYDEESAGLKTQEDIGDPDMIGEQLNVKPKKTVRIFVLLFLLYIVLGFSVGYRTELFDKYVALESAFFLTIPVAFMIILIAAITQKTTVISAFSAFGSLIFLQGYIVPIITEIIVGADSSFIKYTYGFHTIIGRGDFESDAGYYLTDYFKQFDSYQSILSALCLVFVLITAVCAVWSIIIIIKTQRMKNSRNDYYISIVLKVILIFITLIAVGASAADVIRTVNFPYEPNVKQSLTDMDDQALEMIKNGEVNSFAEDNSRVFSKDGTVYEYCESMGDEVYSADRSTLEFKISSYELYLEITDNLRYYGYEKKPIYTHAEAKNIMEKMKTVTVIDDAPKPYEIKYTNPENVIEIVFPCEYYGELRYVFTNQNDEFVLNESIIRTEVDVKPSEEIRVKCESLLKEEYKNTLYKNEIAEYPDSEIMLVSKEYRVNYDAYSDTYEFLYSNMVPVLTTKIDGKTYVFSSEFENTTMSARVSQSGKKVRIDNEISDRIVDTSDNDYSSFVHNAYEAKDYFEENYGIKLYGFIYYFDDDVGWFVNDF